MRDTKNHFRTLIRLLDLESDAEAQRVVQQAERLSDEAAERRGSSLRNLVIRDRDWALGGRIVLTLGRRDPRKGLPWNRLGVGTPVVLAPHAADSPRGWRGVVSGRDDQAIQVALEEMPDALDEAPAVQVSLAFDEVARRRQRAALEQVDKADRGRLGALRKILLGVRPPQFDPIPGDLELPRELNASQQEAIRFAFSARDVAVIQGPPGTGKTTTLVAFMRQATARGHKILACAPSNLAVDHLLERLLRAGQTAVRLGHPARVLPELQQHTLDLQVDAHPDVALARKLVRKALQLRNKASKYTRARPARGARESMRHEARQLMADARRLESQAVRHILDSTPVVCATLTGIDDGILGQQRFHWAVIDEAAQATEPACWIPLLRCERLLLAGDHCQLPPTVISPEAAEGGFAVSLMERLIGDLGEGISRMLKVQYRMHEQIMGFSSAEFYHSELVADPSVQHHTLADLPHVVEDDRTREVLEFIDTAGAGYDEEVEPDGESRMNSGEADWVQRRAEALLDRGLPPSDLAIIAPYAAQVRLLRGRLPIGGLEIDTVDGFQGREKEAVIVSLVRSNPNGEIGFLADIRRTNVALTRARRKLVVIGDSATISTHPFYRRLVDYFERSGAYRTVWESD